MNIPKYWAEEKALIKVNGRSQTYRRFGWSDISEEDARSAARQRVDEAVSLAKAGESVRRVDHKVAYNGAEGLPIREEVVKTLGETIISRNSYGSLCLNTPDVVFADIDIFDDQGRAKILSLYVSLILGAIYLVFSSGVTSTPTVVCVAVLVLVYILEFLYRSVLKPRLPSAAERALKKIRQFSYKNKDWRLRIYRTPHGYRVMVMHACFSAADPDVYRFFDAVGTDPYYIRMCRNQQCFRARVSPKPWRMGMERIASGSGVWPVKAERLLERSRWVRDYEYRARQFSSCVYVESLGSQRLDAKVERVRAIHDEYSQAGRSLPLA